MKVTPLKKKFGKHEVGSVFELPDKAARLFIKVGKVQEANPSQTYTTRDMRAYQPSPVVVVTKDPPADPPVAEPDAPRPAGITSLSAPTGQPPHAWTDQEKQDVKDAMTQIVERESVEEAGGDNTPDADAPWGRKADGTPKKRPGRAPAVSE